MTRKFVQAHMPIDSSFFLNGIIDNPHCAFDFAQFSENCQALKRLRNKGALITPAILKEIKLLMARYSYHEDIARGITDLSFMTSEITRNPFISLSARYETDSLLMQKITEISDDLHLRFDKPTLSRPDKSLCLFALNHLRTAPVIVGTRDRLIEDTLASLYGSFNHYLTSRGFPDHQLYFAKTIAELETILARVSLTRDTASALSYLHRKSNALSLPIYNAVARTIWMDILSSS